MLEKCWKLETSGLWKVLKLITMQGFTFNLQHYLGFWRSSSKGDQKDLVTILKSHHYPITNIDHSSNSKNSQNITYKIKDNKSQKRFQSSYGRITKGFFCLCKKVQNDGLERWLQVPFGGPNTRQDIYK